MISDLTEPAFQGPVLSCTGISKHFGGVRVLRSVDWELQPGEVHALCGENGAGKSTLARICAGIGRPDEGVMRLDGRTAAWTGSDEALRVEGLTTRKLRGVGFALARGEVLGVAGLVASGRRSPGARSWKQFDEHRFRKQLADFQS